MKTGNPGYYKLAIAAIIGALAFAGYYFYSEKKAREADLATAKLELAKLSGEIANLNTDIESLTENLIITKEELATTTEKLALAINQRDQIGLLYNETADKYNLEKSRMDEFNTQVSNIKGTVTTLEKINATDEELLKKYSKVYFLNENYKPESLAKIDQSYGFSAKENYLFNARTLPFLKSMMSVAKADGIDISVISAYRSFDEQSNLKSSYKMIYGAGANKFSADQGYSEHQLGTTVDLTTAKVGASFEGFENTDAYKWLLKNAWTYGFILSYPKNNQYYEYEPWHWRFVGRELAKKLHDDGKNFYDLDQREIDKYLASFYD